MGVCERVQECPFNPPGPGVSQAVWKEKLVAFVAIFGPTLSYTLSKAAVCAWEVVCEITYRWPLRLPLIPTPKQPSIVHVNCVTCNRIVAAFAS